MTVSFPSLFLSCAVMPFQNIFVVCDESDIAFWADSESDNEDRSDEDIVEAVSIFCFVSKHGYCTLPLLLFIRIE